MSFGTSPADVDTVVAFCRALHGKCKDAGGDYCEISYEVRGLHRVLKHLKYEVEAPESPVNQQRSIWSRQLGPIVGDCDYTLHELDDLVQKHSLSTSPNASRADIERRGSSLDTLGLIRVKLLSHKSSLTKFLDKIQLPQDGEVPEALDNHDGHLDDILDKVDIIATLIQSKNRRNPTKQNDDREIWKQFRTELIAEGFSSEVLEHNKDVLRAYIREVDQNGLLDEVPSSSQPVPASGPGSGPERWLEPVKAVQPKDQPPTFSSLDLTTEDASAKAMLMKEENMKFPQSMKLDLRKPEVRGSEVELKQTAPSASRQPRSSGNGHRLPTQIPRLITSNDNDEKAVQYYNTDGSSDEDSDRDSRKRYKNMQLGEVIKTTELIAYSQALQLHPHSPSSFRSTQSYFEEDATGRALPYQAKKQIEYGTSPVQPGAIPIPQPNPRTFGSSFGTSPGPFRLAPDRHGNEIPPEAKWTKINRRLVSPEVLDQDHRRYEARPEFVAVLGVLSRAEIESLAERSRILRDARHRRSMPVQVPPPAHPPRPIPVPGAHHSSSRHKSGRDTPSSSSDSESSDSDHHRRRKSKGRRGYAGSNIGASVSGYPNPYGQPLPSPVRSLSWKETRGGYSSGKDHDRDRDRDRERDVSRDKHGDGSRHRRHREHARGSDRRDRDRGGAYQKSSRWKENLTAAGIGGAAVSLLNVLSEAAEGL